MEFRKTLYWKISRAFVLLVAFMGVFHFALQYLLLKSTSDKMDQFLGWGIASSIAGELQPSLLGDLNYWELQRSVHRFVEINPGIDIYLLDLQGRILADFSEYRRIRRQSVRTAPILDFIQQRGPLNLPLYGDDPTDIGRELVFSAAPVLIHGQAGYVYVTLTNSFRSIASNVLFQKAVLRSTLASAAGLFLVTVILGGFIFYALTKRLRETTQTLQRYATGDFSVRLNDSSGDELGTQAYVINRMADSVVSQMTELKTKDELRRELVANVSHDLRGPTTSILGYLDMILQEGRILGTGERELCEAARRNASSLSVLLSELFELADLEAKESKPDLEPFAMGDLFDDLIISTKPAAAAAQVQVIQSCSPSLPLVKADIGMIGRVLANLLQNALRYTPAGGTVTLLARTAESGVEVSVIDTGTGISPEDLPKIFDRFYQSEGSSNQIHGMSGLGLAIVKRIVEAHRGSIQVSSGVGQGTTFSFTLEAAKKEQ